MTNHRTRIAIVTNDVLTDRMAGPAIRAWQMAGTLSADHEVRLVSTSAACTLSSPAFGAEFATEAELHELVSWCDVVIFQGTVMYEHPFLYNTDKIVVVDIYNPMHLEVLEQAKDRGEDRRRLDVINSVLMLSEQLARGDFFLTASSRQRTFWLGHLAAVGRVNAVTYDDDPSLKRLISVVPFGVLERPPHHERQVLKGVVPGIGKDDKVILWGGGIYNWFDPLSLLHAVDRLRHHMPNVRLYFLGLRHPNPLVPTMRMAALTRSLADELGLTGVHVFFNEDWVAYEDRESYLLEADLGVSTHLDHVETAMSFRTRILDYLWAGLPIVATEGDFFADVIDAEGLGLTVEAANVQALEGALWRLLGDEELAAQCGARSQRVSQQYLWPRVLEPLVEFCRQPRRAADLLDPSLAEWIGQVQRPARPPQGIVDNLRIMLDHLAEGGPRRVVEKATSRLRHRRQASDVRE